MGIRTTDVAVQGILRGNWDGNTPLDPFIAAASMVIDNALPYFAQRGRGYTAAQLEIMERWLSAHFYQKMDAGYMSKSTGGASGSFQRKMGEGFEITEYGRAACEMDITRVLSAIGKGHVAGVAWLGKSCWDLCHSTQGVGTGSIIDYGGD